MAENDGLGTEPSSLTAESTELISSMLSPEILVMAQSPLYVGQAKNLKSRLKQHSDRLDQTSELDSEAPNEDEIAAIDFASRTSIRQIDSETLHVACLVLPDRVNQYQPNPLSVASSINVLETYLLKAANPPLSRR